MSMWILSQKRRQSQKAPQTLFISVLQESGVTLRADEECHVLSQEQALVVRDIDRCLTKHISYPNNLQEFLSGFKSYVVDEHNFRQALLPTRLKKAEGVRQDSVIRLLLHVSCLQSHVVDKVLDEITTRALEEVEETPLIKLLLAALQFLPFIEDPTTLTTKLLDILEVAEDAARHEILNMVPEIIPDGRHEEAAKQLSLLLDNREQFAGAIINCLNGLDLSCNARGKVRDHILTNLLNSFNVNVFPVLLEFLITDCDSKTLPEVLLKTRHAADSIMGSEKDDCETRSNKQAVCDSLFMLSRKVLDGWLQVITSIHNFEQHKPIDILILVMLHSYNTNRNAAIEAAFKKRIKTALFKPPLLDDLFKHYLGAQVIKDHLESFIKISHTLLNSQGDLLFDFSSLLYTKLFLHPQLEYPQRYDIISSLVHSLNTGNKQNITPILNILTMLLEDNAKLQPHTLQLMTLLENFGSFALHEIKLLFNLLCSLTCSKPSDDAQSGLKDEIHMLIRKRVSLNVALLRHRGIVAAVMMVKHLVSTEDKKNLNVSYNDTIEISDLPAGESREAVDLLELTHTSAHNSHHFIGLFYDELASMLYTSGNLDGYFMSWIYKTFTERFQNAFVTENLHHMIDEIPVNMKYSLNTSKEQDVPIAINIAELSMKAKTLEDDVIITLPSFFRLLRLIHFRFHDGDLENIDALLGCAVLMPDTDDLDHYNSGQIRMIADCVFHCINWFREVISAFARQRNKKLRIKVIRRLDNLIELEDLLDKCLEDIPDHNLPLSYFDITPQNKPHSSVKPKETNRGRKRRRVEAANETSIAAATQLDTQSTSKTKSKSPKSKLGAKKNFRDLDIDVMVLFKYPLQLDGVQASQLPKTQVTFLNVRQYNFILKDLLQKIQYVTKTKHEGLSHINLIVPEDLIRKCAGLLPYINRNFNATVEGIKSALEKSDGLEDSPEMLTDEMHHVKTAFDTTLEFYYQLFSWSGFQQTKHRQILRDCLRSFESEQSDPSEVVSVKRMVCEFSNQLETNAERCLYLSSGAHLVQTLEALYLITMSNDLKKKIYTASKYMVSKVWYNSFGHESSGKDTNIHVDRLIKSYMGSVDLEYLCNFIDTVQGQVGELKAKDDRLPVLKSVSKSNFHALYRNLCQRLYDIVRTEVSALTNRQHLNLWQNTTFAMKCLMAIAKVHETKTNLAVYLKKSIGILKVFLSHGIPIMEILLKSEPDGVVAVLKTMQTSTRFLHHLCCTSKFTKDSGTIAYMPSFRQTLESLLYRVKAALVANKCADAFWMGALKNKNIQGDDVCSQSTTASVADDGEEESENELPQDDESDDELPAPTASDSSEVY